MEIIRLFPSGDIAVNTYIVHENGAAVLIDTPFAPDEALDVLKENSLTLKKILLTHGHFDHIMSAQKLKDITGAEIFIHENDLPCLSDNTKNAGRYFGFEAPAVKSAVSVKDGDVITEGGMSFKVMNTPGHTDGSVLYITDSVIFSGDTLFCRSIGRTDVIGGNPAAMKQSLKKIAAVEGKYEIFPGHGGISTLDDEKLYNVYLKDGYDDFI